MPPPGLLYMPCQSHVASGLPAACPLAGLFYKIEPNSPSCGMMCPCKAQHLVTAPALPVRSLPPPPSLPSSAPTYYLHKCHNLFMPHAALHVFALMFNELCLRRAAYPCVSQLLFFFILGRRWRVP